MERVTLEEQKALLKMPTLLEESQQYITRGVKIHARQITEECETIDTLEGNVVGWKGDYVVTGVDNEVYPVPREKFENNYEEFEDGYRKKEKVITANRAKKPFKIELSDNRGTLTAKAGDMIVAESEDSLGFYVVDSDIFDKLYKPHISFVIDKETFDELYKPYIKDVPVISQEEFQDGEKILSFLGDSVSCKRKDSKDDCEYIAIAFNQDFKIMVNGNDEIFIGVKEGDMLVEKSNEDTCESSVEVESIAILVTKEQFKEMYTVQQ